MSAALATATVVLAAGAGRRFGGPKQLAEVGGRPMLERVLEVAAGFGAPQLLVVGARAELVREQVRAPGWRTVEASDWVAGPGASLRAGLAAAPAAEAALVLLGDLPWLRREAIERVLAAAAATPSADAVRAYEGETPGHPLLLRGELLAVARRAPDAGLRRELAAAGVQRVACEGLGTTADVDTPEDLAGGSGG